MAEVREPLPRALWAILGALLAAKAWLIVHHASTPQVWFDEFFYFTTAFDIVHWGERGIPHPQFLFYPPLLSALALPWHGLDAAGFDLSMTRIYQLSLLTLSVVTATTVISAYRLVEELFGERSLGVALLVALSSPAYLGLHFMSEGLFLALYSGHLLFLTRWLLRRHTRDAAVAGLLTAAMIWTRPNGILIVAVTLGLPLLEWLLGRRDAGSGRGARIVSRLRTAGVGYVWLLVPALVARGAWSALSERFADPSNWNLGASTYVRAAWGFLQDGPVEMLLLAHRVGSNAAYVVLGTFGLAIPLLVHVLGPGQRLAQEQRLAHEPDDDAARRARTLRIIVASILCFGALTASAGAVHMRFYGGVDPDNAKYLLYGRYVEYLIVPLLALGVGALLQWRRTATTTGRIVLALSVGLGVAVCLTLVPSQLFQQLVSYRGLLAAPNHQGMTWLLWLWSTLSGSPAVAFVALACTVAIVMLWTVPGRGAHRLAIALTAVPLVVNLLFLAQAHRSTDSRWRADRARLSSQLERARDLWSDGLCIEWPRHRGQARQNTPVWVAYFDHLEHTVVGECFRIAPDLALLADSSQGRALALVPRERGRWRLNVRLFAPLAFRPDEPLAIFEDGFESGDLRTWHRMSKER